MKHAFIASIAFAGIFVGSAPSFAQSTLVVPGTGGSAPISRSTGVGPDSRDTGYSVDGRGGAGGVGGGATTNGTAAGSGTLTGGNPSGYPDRN